MKKNKPDGIDRLDDSQWPPIVIETTTPLQDVRNLLDSTEAGLCQVSARARIRRGPPWMDIRPAQQENAHQILRDALKSLLSAAKRGELKEFRVIHGFGYLPPDEVGPWTGLSRSGTGAHTRSATLDRHGVRASKSSERLALRRLNAQQTRRAQRIGTASSDDSRVRQGIFKAQERTRRIVGLIDSDMPLLVQTEQGAIGE